MLHVAVHGFGVRPIRFNGDNVETVVLNQVLGDSGSGAVEFRGAVAGETLVPLGPSTLEAVTERHTFHRQ